MKKFLMAVLAAALAASLLAGCGGSSGNAGGSPSANSASEGGTGTDGGAADAASDAARPLYVGIAQDLDDSLDPHKTVAAGTREVLFNVFEGLVKPDPDGRLVPALASDYDISDDHLTYTFTMRPGVKFHNGQDVTAEDAAWSILRCRDAEESGVLKVEAFSAIADVTAPDSSTLVITLLEPSNEFLSYLTCAVLPADYTEQDTAPVGTGPFRFVSRSAQENVVLERFDGYWGEPAKLEKVVYRIIENADSIMMSLQSGAVDLFAHLTITQAEQLPEDFHV
ncbi:MAG: ABC transporter substrate-binding protein, partial [Oscillibacter sp.]|nr:ABC transporter substrate-binding protein [Oscillibacter sp.]